MPWNNSPGAETCLQAFFTSALLIPGLAQWHSSWPNRTWIPCDSPAQADPPSPGRTTLPLIQLLGIGWWGRQEQHGNRFHHNHCKDLHLMWGFFCCCSALFFSSLLVLFLFAILRDLPALPKTDSCVKCSLHLCMVPKQRGSFNEKSEEEGEFYGLQKSHSKGAAMERWFYFIF